MIIDCFADGRTDACDYACIGRVLPTEDRTHMQPRCSRRINESLPKQGEEEMRGIKCADCAEYKNEWCEKIIDSPHPDLTRDCQYWHEKKDMVEVVRCRDCVHCADDYVDTGFGEMPTFTCDIFEGYGVGIKPDHYCSYGERGDSE